MQNQTTPGALLTAMRTNPPLVQCITNYVAMNIAANVMLAAGASPAMVHAEEEAGEFAAICRCSDDQYRHIVDGMDRRHEGGGAERGNRPANPGCSIRSPIMPRPSAARRSRICWRCARRSSAATPPRSSRLPAARAAARASTAAIRSNRPRIQRTLLARNDIRRRRRDRRHGFRHRRREEPCASKADRR